VARSERRAGTWPPAAHSRLWSERNSRNRFAAASFLPLRSLRRQRVCELPQAKRRDPSSGSGAPSNSTGWPRVRADSIWRSSAGSIQMPSKTMATSPRRKPWNAAPSWPMGAHTRCVKIRSTANWSAATFAGSSSALRVPSSLKKRPPNWLMSR